MMDTVIESLKQIQIVYDQNVTALKTGIALRYPDASSKERAILLAKAIRQILKNNLIDFDEPIQQALIQNLLERAVQKQDFAINVYDVLECYCTMEEAVNEHLPLLMQWLTITQKQDISLDKLTNTLYTLQGIPILSVVPDSPSIDLDKLDLNTTDLNKSDLNNLDLDKPPQAFASKKIILLVGSLAVILITLTTITLNISKLTPTTDEGETTEIATIESTPSITFLIPEEDYLLSHLQYKEINQVALQDWLTGRNSLLAEEPYFSTIISSAASYNINPLLMFAITGQEQGFVPKNHQRAQEIANNPFNVFGSWQDFNTNIEDTSLIAARTIINLSKGCPEDADPIKWLNRKYAEDPNWHKGVSAIFNQLEAIAG